MRMPRTSSITKCHTTASSSCSATNTTPQPPSRLRKEDRGTNELRFAWKVQQFNLLFGTDRERLSVRRIRQAATRHSKLASHHCTYLPRGRIPKLETAGALL